MNTRLQVEHGITELCYGVDLVDLMLMQADCQKAGQGGTDSKFLTGLQKSRPHGAAIEARICAEVPYRKFEPSPGLLQQVEWKTGNGIRIDTWIETGQEITSYYGLWL